MEEEKKKERKRFGSGFRVLILVLVLVVAAFIALNEFYINILWFTEVGYLQVFLKALITKVTMGGPLFLGLFIILSIYYKLLTLAGGSVKIVKGGKKKFIRGKLPFLMAFVVSVLASVMITSDLWYRWLEFTNSVAFNVTDPIFNLDLSFYMFRLPFYEGLLSIGYILLAILFGSTVIYSLLVIATKNSEFKRIELQELQGIEMKGFFSRLWTSFRVQLSIFAALFFVLISISMYFKRFSYLYNVGNIIYGASYTDVHILIPFYLIMAGLSILAALATLYLGLAKKIKPLLITAALLVVVNLIGLGVAWIVDAYVVAPNEFSKEKEYIEYTIEYTRMAYGVNDVEVKEYDVQQNITADDIEKNETTVNNIPINDYLPTLDTYNSLQGIRPYYEFKDIDVDRYMIDDVYTQVFISPREMNNDRLDSTAQTWINLHLKYTHGFGIAMSPVNAVSKTGQPLLIAKNIPTESDYEDINVDQGRIYFGEAANTYAVVNTLSKEFDYPQGNDNVENVYDGEAGIPMTFLNKIAFSLSNGTMKFLLSSDVTSESKVIINRNIAERVAKIAPFFYYDDDPYVVVVDGKLYWIMDAMTMTDRYPYSKPYGNGSFNYIRNSVKVVIDAYNGDVTFYLIDETDPLAAVYAKIYPDLFTPFSDMPAEIKAHLRYSEDMFGVQADIYRTYHMTNATVFYNKEDLWEVSTQFYQTSSDPVNVNASYLIMKLPEREEEFLLMLPYTPQNKDNMVAWMAGICDGDDYGQLIVYQFSKQNLVYGTMQIEQRIDQDTTISPQLTLLSQQGSEVIRGNLLTIPIEDGLVYVEPIYIQASGGASSLPEVKKVIVSYGDSIVMTDTIDEALTQIFGLKGDNDSDTPVTDIPLDGTTAQLIAQAQDLYNKANAAAMAGDWANYGIYIDQLGDTLTQLEQLSGVTDVVNQVDQVDQTTDQTQQ